MNRRNFLKSSLASALLAGSGETWNLLKNVAHAEGFAGVTRPILVNVMLAGAPDFRHIFPPAFNQDPASFGFRYWEARAGSHSIAQSTSAYQARWDNDFFHLTDNSVEFGILKKCGWLARMWDAGKVAIICNAVGGTTRDHDHCLLIMDQGNVTSGPNDRNRSGWGGRLAAAANGNVVALTQIPRRFCFGPNLNDPEDHDNRNLIAARNTREFNLYNASDDYYLNTRGIITRSLKSYYAAKQREMDSASIYRKFMDHEQKLREFGDLIDARLQTIPLPASIESLLQGGLSRRYFAEQIRNLHDSLAANDILDMSVASLEFGSFDSHKEQKDFIEPKFQDMFGDGKGLDTLYQEIPSDAADNLVFVIGGEFGRRLRANGDRGTDHGRGNTMLVIGNQVKGGVYGEMFPQEELTRLDEPLADIEGLTDIDHIFGAVCDRMVPGSGDIVFPGRTLARKESGVDFSRLFI